MATDQSTLPTGIRKKRDRPGFEAIVSLGGKAVSKYFSADTPLSKMVAWRRDTKLRYKHSVMLAEAPVPPKQPTGGFVYFVHQGDHVKIGKTKDVAQRMSELQTAHALPIRLVAWIYTLHPGRIEAELLNEYAASRARGEWFNLTDDIVNLIRRHHWNCLNVGIGLDKIP